MNNSERLVQIHKMLDALLKSDGLTDWVGGYVYGRTSNDDPFIVLYPAADHLKEKLCRVYPHQFKKLPAFIDTGRVPADTDGNPSKDKAQRAGIYHDCPRFKIVMHLGRETQMGREKRFSDVLYVPASEHQKNQESIKKPAGATPDRGNDEDVKTHWRVEAATSADPMMFDTAVAKLEPWFQNSDNVQQFRQLLFGEWDPACARGYTVALEAYGARRKLLNGSQSPQEAHRLAKERALEVYHEEMSGG